MENLTELINAAARGDTDAFAEIVGRFQDMAYGYAYAILSDFHLAQDAAQEAFVEAFYNLSKLNDPAAFPGWFRQIVRFRCNRLIRGKQLPTVPLEEAIAATSSEQNPQQAIESLEIRNHVLNAISGLSQPLREATTLFYVNGYSQHEIADFLEVPVNTVKSRLHASRQQLKERMMDMVKDTFDEHKLPKNFASKVIEGVPRISYHVQRDEATDEQLCPEGVPFPSCLSACLKTMGVDFGYRKIHMHNMDWRLNNAYVTIMGASGGAVRLIWNPGKWDGSNVDLILMAADPLESYRRAFEAVGYECDIIGNAEVRHEADPTRKFFERHENHDAFRDRIINSIREKGRPVIAMGVVGPPECCVISGYDEEGEVLIGWSYFQEFPELAGGIEFESSGYFRKRDWFRNTPGIILIGEKRARPPKSEWYRKALERAIEIARTPEVHGRKSGLAAYDAWAADLRRDEDFPADDLAILNARMIAHDDAMHTVAEGRWYGAQFLKQIAEDEPLLAENLSVAAARYEEVHQMIWQGWGLVGGLGRTDEQVKKLAEPDVRRQLAPLILKAKETDAQAVEFIEKALSI